MRKISDLPHFLISRIERSETEIIFSGKINGKPPVFGYAWLYRSATNSIRGALTVANSDDAPDTLRASRKYLTDEPIIGEQFPLIDGRWNAYQIAMIVDENHLWQHVQFKATDAIHVAEPNASPGWRRLQKAENSAIPIDLKIIAVIPSGWDHEHCELCWKTIGKGGDDFGYVYQNKQWLCENCYLAYAEKHDFSFIEEGNP